MMTLATLVSALLGVAQAAVNAYDLSLALTVNGKSLSSPNVLLREGETREVGTDPKNFVEVLAVEGSAQGHAGIFMQFTVGTKSPDGRRVVTSRPRILVNENEPALITFGDGGSDTLGLSVVARRRLAR